MALKVELKPGEHIILGDCVVTNADQRTRLVFSAAAFLGPLGINGELPCMRTGGQHGMEPSSAGGPARQQRGNPRPAAPAPYAQASGYWQQAAGRKAAAESH